MALATLLDYLIEEKKKCTLVIGDHIVINETAVRDYEMNGNCCKIYTNEGHKVKLNLEKFRKVTLDKTPYEPTTPIKMEHCLHKLEGEKPYNALLEAANSKFIAGFYDIGNAG